MLLSGVKMFNTGFLNGNKAATGPCRAGLNFKGGEDVFVRSCALKENEDNITERLSRGERRYLGEDVKYLEDTKEILKTTPFVFKKGDEEFKGTLTEYFEDSKIGDRGEIPRYEVFHGTTTECVTSMLQGGLDYTKTGRIKCGPGTYFVPCQGVAMIFGRAFLKAAYKGDKETMPVFEESFYEPVEYHAEMIKTVADELDIPKDTASKLIKVAAHDILVNDMGIDVLWSTSGYGSGSYFVVLNDKCMRLSRG